MVRKWLRLHSILTAVVLGVYFFAAFFQGPGFFMTDIRSKIHVVADTITLTAGVLGVPAKPVVVASVVCDNGSLSIDLDWADDGNSYTYEISRDGVLLVTGLTDSSYHDIPGVIAADYDYIVTSYGPMGPGFAISDVVSVTTPSGCASTLPDPSVTPNAINHESFRFQSGVPVTSDKTPTFSGTTNIPFAMADIVIHSQVISLRTTANANGYWEAAVPTKLSTGDHVLFVTAMDPADNARVATFTIPFRVLEEGDGDDSSANTHRRRMAIVSVPTTNSVTKNTQEPSLTNKTSGSPVIPVDFLLRIPGNQTVFQGDTFESEIIPLRIDSEYRQYPVTIRYQVIDSYDAVVVAFEKQYGYLKSGQNIRQNISLPSDIASGEYVLQAEMLIGDFDIVRQNGFLVKELPLLTLGGGAVITYPQFVRNIGWVAFILLFSTLVWALLWIREYWLYAHAVRHVVEKSLSKKGLISKRREVSQ